MFGDHLLQFGDWVVGWRRGGGRALSPRWASSFPVGGYSGQSGVGCCCLWVG